MIAPVEPMARADVVAAIRTASAETGADFDYLMRTAMRESALNPNAKAASSSATGLFQFIEQTWLGMVKKHGAAHGLSGYAEAIERRGDGRFTVADKGLRREILALRQDPEIAARMAGELTADHRDMLESRLGRPVTAGELYAAHFLGPAQAARLIAAAGEDPEAAAAELFPAAACANKSIFYCSDGEARSVEAVYARLTRLPEAGVPPSAPAPEAPAAHLMTAELRAGDLESLFRTQPPAPLAGSWPKQPLMMSPEVVQMLAALDPIPAQAAAWSDAAPKDDGRERSRWHGI